MPNCQSKIVNSKNPMQQSLIPRPSNIKNFALGMLGMFIGALIFILGIAVGSVLSRPGGVLFNGASPFPNLNPLGSEAGIVSDSSGNAATGRLNQRLIDDVLGRLRTQWYGELPTNDKLTDGAIRGMVSSLGDQFTQYVEPKFAKILEQDSSGSFEGIGATLKSTQGGAVQIVRTFVGAPADKTGVLPGDLIEAVDGKSVLGLGTNEVAALVRGPAGSKVTLTLRRADKPRPFDLSITRSKIDIPLVTSKMHGDVAYISLFDFSAQANKQLTTDLQKLLDQKPKGLILDLRDNPGGLLSQSVEVGDLFLKKGTFIIERDIKGNKKTSETTDRGIAQDIPMVVLVNGGSASAAEIVSGALQDYGRAKLIGETTFGKGSVQSPQTLSNGGQLRITIERWFTPKDRAIHGTGITPDYIVVNDHIETKNGKDAQLQAAIDFLSSGKTPAPTPIPTVEPAKTP